MWLLAGCAVPTLVFFATLISVLYAFWPEPTNVAQRQNPVPIPEPTIAVEPAVSDAEPPVSDAEPASQAPSNLNGSVSDSLDLDPPAAARDSLDLQWPDSLQPLPLKLTDASPWRYEYRVEMGKLLEPDVHEGSLMMSLATNDSLDAALAQRGEVGRALQLPGSFVVNCVENERRHSLPRQPGSVPKNNVTSQIVALENGLAILCEGDRVGTIPPITPAELAFMPFGAILDKENDFFEVQYELRGLIPTSRKLTSTNASLAEIFESTRMHYFSDPTSEAFPEINEVVLIRSFRFMLEQRTENSVIMRYEMTTLYKDDDEITNLMSGSGYIVYDPREERILSNSFDGLINGQQGDRPQDRKAFRIEIIASEPWSRERALAISYSRTHNLARDDRASTLAIQGIDHHFRNQYNEETISPDGHWATAQSYLGFQLIDQSAEGTPTIVFRLGGIGPCFWDRSSRALIRLLPQDNDHEMERAEILRLSESGVWEAEIVSLPGEGSTRPIKLAINEAHQQIICFSSSGIECLNSQTLERRWMARTGGMSVPFSLWFTEAEMIALYEFGLLRFELATGKTDVVKRFPADLPTIPLHRKTETWFSRFSQNGDFVWVEAKEGICRIDTRSGEVVETWEDFDHLLRYAAVPTKPIVVAYTPNELWSFNYETGEKLVCHFYTSPTTSPSEVLLTSDDGQIIILQGLRLIGLGATVVLQ